MLLLVIVIYVSVIRHISPYIHGNSDADSQPTCVIEFNGDLIEDNLTVSWALPSDVIDRGSSLLYIVTWTTDYNYGNCTVTTLTSCLCYYGNDDVMDSDSLFSLNVTIIEENVPTEPLFQALWSIDSEVCLKPLPVAGVALASPNSTCINVTWKHRGPCNEEMAADEVLYRISYKQTDGDSIWKRACLNCSNVYVICGLFPYTGYDVTVQNKMYGSGNKPKGHWSDYTVLATVTTQDVPRGSPEVIDAGYTLLKDNCKLANSRGIRLYWKEVAKHLRNGEITTYQITVMNAATEYRADFSTQRRTCHFDVNIHCDIDYDINLRAGTNIGLSSNWSAIHIPVLTATTELISSDDIIPEINMKNQLINISVTARWQKSLYKYIVWCKVVKDYSCESAIAWQSLTTSGIELTINTSKVPFPLYELKLGVAKPGSGIIWASCLYMETNEMTSPNLQAIPSFVGQNSIEIAWESMRCSTGHIQPYVVSVIVFVCPTANMDSPLCNGPTTEHIVDGRSTSFIIEPVDTYTVYKIYAVAVSLHGKQSQQSPPIYAQPSYKGQFVGSPLSIVLLAACCVILGLCIVFITRYLWKKFRIHYRTLIDIEDPPMPLQDMPNG